MPFGKRYANDLRIITEQMEDLFQLATDDDEMNDNNTSYFENKEQYKHLCSYNENHQLTKYLLSEKKFKRVQWQKANYIRKLPEKDRQNILSTELNNLRKEILNYFKSYLYMF